MKNEILHINTISQLHETLSLEKPKHPLISVLDAGQFRIPTGLINVRVSVNFYYIGMKNGDCGLQYGRNHYDFEEGVMAFSSPNQIFMATSEENLQYEEGWLLYFHPDLIRDTSLGENIHNYSFFSYEVHEALHLSDQEKKTLNDCVEKIRDEYNQRIDNHSQRVIVSGLELLLNYCLRYYERQFNTRTTSHKDVVTRIESTIRNYLSSGKIETQGPLTIQFLAEEVHLSPSYLSDLLKKETGRSAKDHINDFLVEKAKNLLLSTDHNVSEIAYTLGFNYPHYFSRLFKSKTGITPHEYRRLN